MEWVGLLVVWYELDFLEWFVCLFGGLLFCSFISCYIAYKYRRALLHIGPTCLVLPTLQGIYYFYIYIYIVYILLYLPYLSVLYELISGCTYLYLRLHFSHCTSFSL